MKSILIYMILTSTVYTGKYTVDVVDMAGHKVKTVQFNIEHDSDGFYLQSNPKTRGIVRHDGSVVFSNSKEQSCPHEIRSHNIIVVNFKSKDSFVGSMKEANVHCDIRCSCIVDIQRTIVSGKRNGS